MKKKSKMSRLRGRLADWLLRYGPAEIVSIVVVYVSYYLARLFTQNLVVLAYVSAWAESASYYAVIIISELLKHKKFTKTRYLRSFVTKKLVHLFVEFGPAEVIDSLILRPLFIGLGVYLLGPLWGLLAGKIVSDLIFYVPVIIAYELRRYFHKKKATDKK